MSKIILIIAIILFILFYNDHKFERYYNTKSKVSLSPIIKNINSKYKLYGDDLLISQPAKTITKQSNLMSNQNKAKVELTGILPNIIEPEIDQTINTNIINYINKSENQNKTIKQIYDEMTNDNRHATTQNIDDLEAFTKNDNYNLGEKYGASKFDTYSLNV